MKNTVHWHFVSLEDVAEIQTGLSKSSSRQGQFVTMPYLRVPIEINTEPDHAHVLFLLGRTASLSDVVGGLKKSATEWLRARSPQYAGFHWQAGYGAFSVSQSAVEDVRTYIRNQAEHHRVKTFQDEFRAFLKKYEIEYDEKYVWD